MVTYVADERVVKVERSSTNLSNTVDYLVGLTTVFPENLDIRDTRVSFRDRRPSQMFLDLHGISSDPADPSIKSCDILTHMVQNRDNESETIREWLL